MFCGRYGYGGKFSSGEWLKIQKEKNTTNERLQFATAKALIGIRQRDVVEKIIISLHDRNLLTDDEFLQLIEHL